MRRLQLVYSEDQRMNANEINIENDVKENLSIYEVVNKDAARIANQNEPEILKNVNHPISINDGGLCKTEFCTGSKTENESSGKRSPDTIIDKIKARAIRTMMGNTLPFEKYDETS